MLLVELGYDAKAEGMVGTDWAINTSKLMAGTKLMDGISGSVNQVLTREKAAQMCLNALEAPMVTYDTKGSTITVDGTKINFGASVAKYETSTVAKDQNISKEKLTSGEYTVELGEKLYKDLKKNSTTDAFERPATEWMLKAKSIGTYADAADLSYTATVEIGTIYSDLGLSKGIDDSKVTYYEDGRNLSSSWNQDIVKGSKVEKGGNGTLLEVYYNDDAESLTVIAINTYVGKIDRFLQGFHHQGCLCHLHSQEFWRSRLLLCEPTTATARTTSFSTPTPTRLATPASRAWLWPRRSPAR